MDEKVEKNVMEHGPRKREMGYKERIAWKEEITGGKFMRKRLSKCCISPKAMHM